MKCGATMKPLFYVHSLFCPNNCDFESSKQKVTKWRERDRVAYLYQVLPPGVPYPDDATRGYLLSASSTQVEADEQAESFFLYHPERTAGWEITTEERQYRKVELSVKSRCWVLVMKDP